MEHDIYKTSSSDPIRSRVIGGLSGYVYAEKSHHIVPGHGILPVLQKSLIHDWRQVLEHLVILLSQMLPVSRERTASLFCIYTTTIHHKTIPSARVRSDKLLEVSNGAAWPTCAQARFSPDFERHEISLFHV